jgi:hypothetical protein
LRGGERTAGRRPTLTEALDERARISLAACVIYCCGHSMTGGQGVGDPNVYGVLFLRCRYCRREICIEGAPEVATAPGSGGALRNGELKNCYRCWSTERRVTAAQWIDPDEHNPLCDACRKALMWEESDCTRVAAAADSVQGRQQPAERRNSHPKNKPRKTAQGQARPDR